MMIEQHKYGSVAFYATMFGDIIADADYNNPTSGNNIIAGFKQALKEWREYHEEAAKEYRRIEQRANDEI